MITAFTTKPGETLNTLLYNRGALYEGEIFITLKHLFSVFVYFSFVVRLFEFDLADEALDYAQEFEGTEGDTQSPEHAKKRVHVGLKTWHISKYRNINDFSIKAILLLLI